MFPFCHVHVIATYFLSVKLRIWPKALTSGSGKGQLVVTGCEMLWGSKSQDQELKRGVGEMKGGGLKGAQLRLAPRSQRPCLSSLRQSSLEPLSAKDKALLKQNSSLISQHRKREIEKESGEGKNGVGETTVNVVPVSGPRAMTPVRLRLTGRPVQLLIVVELPVWSALGRMALGPWAGTCSSPLPKPVLPPPPKSS